MAKKENQSDSIPGTIIESNGNTHICRILDLTDEIKTLIRTELSAIAYGAVFSKNSPLKSYHNTLKEFLIRYSSKDETKKKGMIGELLAHLMIPKTFTDLKSLSVLFNKEERSVKKGFDIIYCDLPKKAIWYSEVKSGHTPVNGHHETANTALIGKAHKDLKTKITEDRSSLWDNALLEVMMTLEMKKAKTVSKILAKDSPLVGKQVCNDKNAILVSVLYENTKNPVSLKSIEQYFLKIKNSIEFNNLIIFSIQKRTFEKVADFLAIEVSNV